MTVGVPERACAAIAGHRSSHAMWARSVRARTATARAISGEMGRIGIFGVTAREGRAPCGAAWATTDPETVVAPCSVKSSSELDDESVFTTAMRYSAPVWSVSAVFMCAESVKTADCPTESVVAGGGLAGVHVSVKFVVTVPPVVRPVYAVGAGAVHELPTFETLMLPEPAGTSVTVYTPL